MVHVRRHEFVALLGGVAASWPCAARQQPGKLPTIGFLGANTSIESQRVAAFIQRLRELGWIDGRNLAIEYRWAEGRNEHYAENAAEFDVIVTVATPRDAAV
jgi:putative ABC transport system substrate-binding protein